MSSDLLVMLPTLALAFGLVLCRVGMVVMLMPGIGENAMPSVVRAGIAVGLTCLLLPVAQAGDSLSDISSLSPLAVVGLGAVEILCGAVIGWLARLAAMILPVAGQLISLMTGLSSVLQPDPELGAQTAVLGRFLSLLAPVILLISGLYIMPLKALVGSYALVPLGSSPATMPHWPLLTDATRSVVMMTAHLFTIAVELTAPFIYVSMIWQFALGILSRAVPNLQVYTLAMPLEIAGGLALLAILFTRLIAVWLTQVSRQFAGLPGL